MTKIRKIAVAAMASLCLIFTTKPAFANGTLSGYLNAKLTLQAGCIISGTSGTDNSDVNFGILDFGSHPSTFTGVLTASVNNGSGLTQITCSSDISSLTVSVGAGDNAGQGTTVGTGARAMKLGTSTYLPYDVYSDAALTTPYPTAATARSITLPGTGAPFPLPLFGRVNKTSANAMPSGTYTDVLQVTLSW